jgi:hypothetical protein
MRWQDDTYAEAIAGRIPAGAKLRKDAQVQIAEPKPVIRQSNRQPNKTERRFEIERLKLWQSVGQIREYDYEAVTLKIANGCRYTPDYWVIANDGRTLFYEIKARKMIWDDAIVKLKVAARRYDAYEFWLCAWDKNGWTVERVLP